MEGAAGRFVIAEGGGVEGVKGGEVGHVFEEDGAFDHVIEGEARAGEKAFDIGEDLEGLAGEVGGVDFAGGGIDGDLAGREEEVAAADGLGVGTDGGGGVGGIDDFHGR